MPEYFTGPESPTAMARMRLWPDAPSACDSGPSAGRRGGRSPWNSCATSRSMPGLRLAKSIPVRSTPLIAAPGR